ncbi:hypothetical protein [Streptomyces sp. NPDC097610]|uniref:hypothetical protein n=1 Tax=Streptomyces sp. NPDC097610 TaxID=3157227 RepID=UPI0033244123
MKDLGRAPVNGRSATHYAAVLDRAHQGRLEEAFDSESTLLDAFFVLADSITTDVWVDAEGLPVRPAQKIGGMRVTMDFAKSGATAGVEAPPAARTGDMTEELRAAAQQQSRGREHGGAPPPGTEGGAPGGAQWLRGKPRSTPVGASAGSGQRVVTTLPRV